MCTSYWGGKMYEFYGKGKVTWFQEREVRPKMLGEQKQPEGFIWGEHTGKRKQEKYGVKPQHETASCRSELSKSSQKQGLSNKVQIRKLIITDLT